MTIVNWDEIFFGPTAGPNGLYLHKGEPFDGVRRKMDGEGRVSCEEEYRQGLRWGASKEWYNSGQLYSESNFFRDVLHGTKREWNEDGSPAEDSEYEYGVNTRKSTWDRFGNLTESYEINQDEPDFQLLQALRRAFGQ